MKISQYLREVQNYSGRSLRNVEVFLNGKQVRLTKKLPSHGNLKIVEKKKGTDIKPIKLPLDIVFLLEDEEIFYAEKSFALKNKKDFEFSIVPISENVEKLTLKGFKFETDGIDVKRESSRLVSNVICENEASIEFESGKLIVILKNKKL